MFRPSVNPEVTTVSLAASPDIDKDRHCKTLLTLCQVTTGNAGLENIKTISQWPGGHRAAKTLVVWLLVWPQDSLLWGCLIFKDKMKMVFTVKEVKLLSFPSGAKEAHSRSLLPCSAYQKWPKCQKNVKKMEEGMNFEWIFSRKLLPVGDTYVFLHFGSVLLSQYSASGGLSFIRYGYLCSVNQILQHTSTPLSKTKCLGWFISSQWFPPIAFWNYSLQ